MSSEEKKSDTTFALYSLPSTSHFSHLYINKMEYFSYNGECGYGQWGKLLTKEISETCTNLQTITAMDYKANSKISMCCHVSLILCLH